ncbi:hypothetical protein H5410_031668 [Solanum commersonii]|uniref:Uncharacterized protein n=1 Tax=Solanum commersonii TaxID=4109 RepID=A0A9J5YIX8_SOLCO|nr:hypothetical protein H5410_031668 [Solanum commersonii]
MRPPIYDPTSDVGTPIHLDKVTINKTRPSYAKVKVLVDLMANLLDHCKLQGHTMYEYRVIHPELAKVNEDYKKDSVMHRGATDSSNNGSEKASIVHLENMVKLKRQTISKFNLLNIGKERTIIEATKMIICNANSIVEIDTRGWMEKSFPSNNPVDYKQDHKGEKRDQPHNSYTG